MDAVSALRDHGLDVRVIPGGRLYVTPRERLTDDLRQFIRHHKPEIVRRLSRPAVNEAALVVGKTQHQDDAHDSDGSTRGEMGGPPTPQQQKALDSLGQSPNRQTVIVAGEPEDDHVRVSIALRRHWGNVVGDLHIPKEKWDPWLFLDMVEKQREEN